MASYDIIGNIAILKGEVNDKKKSRKKSKNEKLKQAKELLKIPSIKTIVERIGNVHGRLRTIKIKHILGEKNLIALHKENGCIFKFDISTCYFSPRLSGERKDISKKIKTTDRVLVMFAGVGVYPIVIYKNKKPKEIVSVEIGRECCKYAIENNKLNNIPFGKIKVIQGDVKKKVNKSLGKFDVIVMARPNLKESFLKQALICSKKSTKIFYNGFGNEEEKDKIIEMLVKEAKEFGKKIKILKILKAGDIAPYKFRWRIEMKVL